jgi:hypothetical protein
VSQLALRKLFFRPVEDGDKPGHNVSGNRQWQRKGVGVRGDRSGENAQNDRIDRILSSTSNDGSVAALRELRLLPWFFGSGAFRSLAFAYEIETPMDFCIFADQWISPGRGLMAGEKHGLILLWTEFPWNICAAI